LVYVGGTSGFKTDKKPEVHSSIKVFGEIIETQYLDFLMKKAMPLLTFPLCLSCLVAFHNLYTTKLK